jgi:hypothetical protein
MERIREELRVTIAVALSMLPKRVRRAWADQHDDAHRDAKRELPLAAADAVLKHFNVTPKPRDADGRSLHARLMPPK